MANSAAARSFKLEPAVREQVPVLVGLSGPSGCGKTYTALEIATGIQSVVGGEIVGIDTEGRRMLHYADYFSFRHIDFQPPYGSLDYLAAIRAAVDADAKVVVIDSMSHEHEGPGGLRDFHEKELDRMSGGDANKAERIKALAWQKPKAARRKLLAGIIQTKAHFVVCFRAKNTVKPMKVNGKMEFVQQGFIPITGEEFPFEMTVHATLPPGSEGIPQWHPENPGEQIICKLPRQFREYLLKRQGPLNREVGRHLAEWARGGEVPNRGQAPKGLPERTAEGPAPPPDSGAEKISEAQARRLWALAAGRAKEVGGTNKEIVRAVLESVGLESTKGIGRDQYEAVCEAVQQWEPGGYS